MNRTVPVFLTLTLATLLAAPALADQSCGPAIPRGEVQYMTLRTHEAHLLPDLVAISGFEIVSRQDHVNAGEVSQKQKMMWGELATGGGVLDEKAQVKRLAKAGCHGGILVIHSATHVAGQKDRVSFNNYGMYGNSNVETQTVADVTEYRLRKTRPDARLVPPEAVMQRQAELQQEQPAQTESEDSGGMQPPTADELAEIMEAAEAGDSDAQLVLGLFYGEGLGVPMDLPRARMWIERAANQGNPGAQYTMGLMYYSGTGVPADYVYAHSWLNLAAASGHEDARAALEQLEGDLTPQQIAEAQGVAREFRPEFEN